TVTCRRSASPRVSGPTDGGASVDASEGGDDPARADAVAPGSGAATPGPRAAPHRGQNAKSGPHAKPHAGQGSGRRPPARGQNAKPGAGSKPQPLHAIGIDRQTLSKRLTIALGPDVRCGSNKRSAAL